MLTNRGKWLVLLSICGCALGVIRSQELLAYVGLTALIWLLFEWLVFRCRVAIVCRSLEVQRTFNGGDVPRTLWMNRPVEIELTVSTRVPGGIPFVRLHDFLSVGLETEDDQHIVQACLRGELKHVYQLVPRAAGRFVLPGVCARVSDLQGMFFTQRFLPCEDSFRVLPSCMQADPMPPMNKRHNSLMPPGMHRFLRAGSGPELLELREYVPGDPPKSIAWKVSARKGTLMTRQYESEVPVRVTLFVDGSAGARVGLPGHRAIDSAIATTATLAKSVMADRDPVGLVMYDDHETKLLKHGSGERHLFRILDALAERSFLKEPGPVAFSTKLMDQAWTACEDLYPELLESDVNRVPFFLISKPDSALKTLLLLLPIGLLLLIGSFQFGSWAWWAVASARVAGSIIVLGALLVLVKEMFSIGKRAILKRRLRFAVVLAELFELPADATVRLALDDAVMAKFIYKFLNRIGAPWTDAAFNAHGANIAAGQGRLGVLADSLTRSVALARDNEVFVLIADLLDHAGKLGRLIDAVRVARARHHRVVVICPWPAPVSKEKLAALPQDVIEITRKAEQLRLDGAAEALRTEFRRLQVPFAMASEGKSIRMVLAEAGLAKDGRTSMVGTR
jgi:uncharacterized protein (DUF58 family)